MDPVSWAIAWILAWAILTESAIGQLLDGPIATWQTADALPTSLPGTAA